MKFLRINHDSLLMNKYISVISFILVFTVFVSAQSCGFGCLGLSGVYGGYSFQNYDAAGLNRFLSEQTGETGQAEFGSGEGIRVGSNIFRADFDDYFFTVKGYYQFLKEENQVASASNSIRDEYKLSLNHWGFGVDFGIPLFSLFEWKIIEGSVAIYKTEFKHRQFENNILVIDNKYTADKSDVGYYLGTGLIINLVKNYVSIEGTAGYNNFGVSSFKLDSDPDVVIKNNSGEDLIKGGKIQGTIQLNVGFPL